MRISDWSSDVCSSDLLRAAIAAQRDLQTRIDGIARDAREHDESVAALTERLGIAASGGGVTLLEGMRARLSAARSTASVLEALEESIAGRSAEMAAEDARHAAAWASLTALLEETGATDLQGPRSEEGRVGKEGGGTCRSRWSRHH